MSFHNNNVIIARLFKLVVLTTYFETLECALI